MRTGRETLGSIESAIGKLYREETQLDGSLKSAVAETERLRKERAEALRELARVKLDEMAAGRLVNNLDAGERRAVQVLDDYRLRIASLTERRERLLKELEAPRPAGTLRPSWWRRRWRPWRRCAPRWRARYRRSPSGARPRAPATRPTASPARPRRRPPTPRPSWEPSRSPTTRTRCSFTSGSAASAPAATRPAISPASWIAWSRTSSISATCAPTTPPSSRFRCGSGSTPPPSAPRRGSASPPCRASSAAPWWRPASSPRSGRSPRPATGSRRRTPRWTRSTGCCASSTRSATACCRPAATRPTRRRSRRSRRPMPRIRWPRSTWRRGARPPPPTTPSSRSWRAWRQQIPKADAEVAELRRTAQGLAKRRIEIERVRDRFRGAGYDHPHGTFGNDNAIADALGRMLAGSIGGQILWEILQGGYSTRGPVGRPDFGYPTSPFPFPIPGGGSSGPWGGEWRDPSSRGNWTADGNEAAAAAILAGGVARGRLLPAPSPRAGLSPEATGEGLGV